MTKLDRDQDRLVLIKRIQASSEQADTIHQPTIQAVQQFCVYIYGYMYIYSVYIYICILLDVEAVPILANANRMEEYYLSDIYMNIYIYLVYIYLSDIFPRQDLRSLCTRLGKIPSAVRAAVFVSA